MTCVYVAKSKSLGEWGSDVGLTEHLYKLGVHEGAPEEVVDLLNGEKLCGKTDWALLKSEPLEELQDEAALYERLGRKEKLVDPRIYPGIRNAPGIFKVKILNVENSILVKEALEGREPKIKKPKPAEIGAYLIANALK
ncbi:MAG: hypothetical protein EPN26_06055 [Rhodospirillales bacterium]|nr:MAG: hypothetical protein EPN26_06055 [Rhodospirillales bacterium]